MKIIIAAALLAGLASPAVAATLVVPGDTTGGPTYNRPVTLTIPSTVGLAVPFQVTEFVVSESGTYTLTLLALTQPYDPFLALYDGTFRPTDSIGGIIALDDDLNDDLTRSQIIVNLIAGSGYQAVVSGFANSDFGAYSLTFDGPGQIFADNVGAVPEPATWGLMLVGFGLIGGSARYRRRRTLVSYG